MTLLASNYDFTLPEDRIAHHPARPRDSARLLHVGETLQDGLIRDLPALLRRGDILVANDTRVIPAQLEGRRGGARIGVTLDRPRADGAWLALGRNTRRLRVGDGIAFDAGLAAEVAAILEGGEIALRFNLEGEDFARALREAGALALPPYIARPDGPTARDSDDYQTVFADREGAVAAPTAGLHFTPDLLRALDAAGVARTTVTLHVGPGTFLPMRHDDVAHHRIHAERGEIGQHAAAAINAAPGRIVAVGTTTLRLLESAATPDGEVKAFVGETDLFILPGHKFRTADMLLTNFHLPRSTLFMLVCAFAGDARMRGAYAHAMANNYRFYSYGDASLLERA